MTFNRIHIRASVATSFPQVCLNRDLSKLGARLRELTSLSPIADRNRTWILCDTMLRETTNWFIRNWGSIHFRTDTFLRGENYPFEDEAPKRIHLGICEPKRKILVRHELPSRPGIRASIQVEFFLAGIQLVSLLLSLRSRAGIQGDELAFFCAQLFKQKSKGKRAAWIEIPRLGFRGAVRDLLARISSDLSDSILSPHADFREYLTSDLHLTVFVPQLPSQSFSLEGELPQWVPQVLLLEPKPEEISERFIGQLQSSFGKYRSDLVIARRGRLLVSVKGSFEKRKVFLRGLEVAVLIAMLQKATWEYYTRRLHEDRLYIYKAQLKSAEVLKNFFRISMLNFDTVEFLDTITTLPRFLQRHMRRWYRFLVYEYELGETRQQFEKELDRYIDDARQWEPGIAFLLKQIKGSA